MQWNFLWVQVDLFELPKDTNTQLFIWLLVVNLATLSVAEAPQDREKYNMVTSTFVSNFWSQRTCIATWMHGCNVCMAYHCSARLELMVDISTCSRVLLFFMSVENVWLLCAGSDNSLTLPEWCQLFLDRTELSSAEGQKKSRSCRAML
jgi:hypothetical protein